MPALGWAPDRRLLTPTVTIRPANAGTPESGRFVSARSPENSRISLGNSQRGVGQIGGLIITADGKRLVLWRANSQPGVFLTEIDPGTRRFKQPRRFTLDENGNVAYAWTPDSTAVFFVSNRHVYLETLSAGD